MDMPSLPAHTKLSPTAILATCFTLLMKLCTSQRPLSEPSRGKQMQNDELITLSAFREAGEEEINRQLKPDHTPTGKYDNPAPE